MKKKEFITNLKNEFPEFIEKAIQFRDQAREAKSALIKTKDSYKMVIRENRRHAKQRFLELNFSVQESRGKGRKQWRARMIVMNSGARYPVHFSGWCWRNKKSYAIGDLALMKKVIKVLIGV